MCLSFITLTDKNESTIPEDLKTRLNQVKIKGNINAIEGFFKNLLERENQNAQTAKQIEQLLNTEKNQDNDLRARGGNVQGRNPSDIAAKFYVDALNKFKNDMNLASNANKKLRSMFDTNKANFEILFKSENELEEMFEQYKTKKASQEEINTFNQLTKA